MPACDSLPLVLARAMVGGGAVLTACMLLMTVGCSNDFSQAYPEGVNHPSVGSTITQLELQPLTGTEDPLLFADVEGKVALVNFWGPWCGYCVVEFPHLVELEQHFRKRDDFKLVSVSCSGHDGDDTSMEETTRIFMAQQQADFPTYRDPDFGLRRHIAEQAALDGFGYPTTVLIGKDGKVKGIWIGYRDGMETQMRTAIDAALTEEPTKVEAPSAAS